MEFFLGRRDELKRLNRLREIKKASLVVIKGRRRVGKSTLAREFAKNMKFISFVGLAPGTGMTAQKQRDEFGDQLCVQFGLPRVTFLTWSDAFRYLSQQLTNEETVILFDEISWMGELDPAFLSSLKTWWDQLVTEKNKIYLILCGSISTWIEENILASTAFVGRINLVIHLKPLSLRESISLLRKNGFNSSIYEILKILSVTGGIPWYLDLINPKETADQNIYELCFNPTSQMTNEFQTIFNDLFYKKSEIYRKVLEILTDGMKTQKEIRESLGLKPGGTLSDYLEHLIQAGFISEHYQWSLKTSKIGKQKLYRLSDCFIRFHLKYVAPHKDLIRQGAYSKAAYGKLPGWDAIMGFQLESLLLSNRDFLFEALSIDPSIVVCDNPFIQFPTVRNKGCQIDYLIQTNLKSLIICEFKFRKNEINSSIIQEVKEKCNALSVPKGCGKAAALFHIGGVSQKVEESGHFYRIIDLRDLLNEQ